ncbi:MULTISPECIES: hypothetical protein [unclassified Pseudomonas]|uniref:hypothetical protein n=1 Tax=unclassified Pseudomonas TaxID=196821 RepID=UPI000C868F59|nr:MULTISPECIES: hypothetical protein [unclassified Pseudomonas]PMV85512.1 hypothetical protein C1X51_30200 [Pseudomonas sp. FW306-2-2C-B10A]PMV87726.1 hypothetical protein C1X56_09820 [Pseudomonas sp. GW101-1A09]PMW01262.1 hypothetical protein C1X55_07115 [Pseudomonas sp. GW460-C8]PMW06583.1 hypothetical protein C1X50_08415 [Pseudomonas sp. MPR-TSA4]PMW07500.1 hypothetical protein C1X52_30305 [Pseudomonas sp. FW306-2-1A-C05A]
MSDNQMINVPRDEVERLVKLLQYQAHPHPSPHAEFWQGMLDKPAPAATVQRFWSYEAQNIRCVRESDYDALEQRLTRAEAGLQWETERNALLLAELRDDEASLQGDPGACDPDVYANGKSVCLVDIPKDTAEVICRNVSAVTGNRLDWHYIGGRVHIKALAPPKQPCPFEVMP